MKYSPVKILVVDDDEDDFMILREYINKIDGHEFAIDWCNIYDEAARIIVERKYQLYFVGYRLGAKTGLELIGESIGNNCEEPFIFLTGNGNLALDRKAMETGAVDYLVKGELSAEKLERCIRYSLDRASSLKALRSSERKFRNIFERSKDLVFIADETLNFTEVNNASFPLLGYDRDAMLSKNLMGLLVNENEQAAMFDQLHETGEVSDKEVEITTRSGEKKYCIITLSRETDIAGASYVQGIIHDITSLKRAEKATLMLEKLNVAGRLVRIMAHEVRNPLNNIMLSAEQLEPVIGNTDSGGICLEIITRNSKRIGDLITELLNSSRPDQVSVERMSLQSILDESIDAAMDRITLKHIELKKDYLQEPAWVMADHEKLKIAFLNIIINAIEAMQETEGTLTVSVTKKNLQYVVSIEDSGCGISDENIGHLFEPYFTSKQNGMGLGLASTLNILQSHNASFDVQSKLDIGSVFKLFFNIA